MICHQLHYMHRAYEAHYFYSFFFEKYGMVAVSVARLDV